MALGESRVSSSGKDIESSSSTPTLESPVLAPSPKWDGTPGGLNLYIPDSHMQPMTDFTTVERTISAIVGRTATVLQQRHSRVAEAKAAVLTKNKVAQQQQGHALSQLKSSSSLGCC
ncbi:hypothetical protein HAX54_012603 [Datura stramonium]|uniref:Uncharacterized protein n=1 Tax=Datura stramonium TaxID=4076 RepID=A0ABS8TLU5_DATST|nr:hypothetical protein [Datura stramonium]